MAYGGRRLLASTHRMWCQGATFTQDRQGKDPFSTIKGKKLVDASHLFFCDNDFNIVCTTPAEIVTGDYLSLVR